MRQVRFIGLCTVMLAGPAVAQDLTQGTLTVIGHGEAEVWPDRAAIRLGVQQEAPTGDVAMALMATDMTAVMAQLAELGIAPAEIETSRLSLQEFFEPPQADLPRVSTGYVATQTVTVTTTDLAQISAILDLAVSGTANRLEGISFDVIDDAPGEEAARIDAVAQARVKAEQYATAAGVTLGAIISLSEDDQNLGRSGLAVEIVEPPITDENGNIVAYTDVPVSPRAVDYHAQVVMVWAIE